MSAVLRTSLRQLGCSRRYASSQAEASSSKTPNVHLPPHKMRSLVSLYHQADKFITPENLSEEISNAFYYSDDSATRNLEDSYFMLAIAVENRRQRPKIGHSDSVVQVESDDTWSDQRPLRESKVAMALYGLEAPKKPGLEVLQEEQERVQEMTKRDEANRSS